MTIKDDTPIMPEAVADCIVSEAETIFGYAFTLETREEMVNHLVTYGERIYQHSSDFKKKIQGKGNKGRDILYMFNRHWLAAYLKDNHIYNVQIESVAFRRFANGEG